MIQLIVVDLDGTLLNESKRIPQGNISAMEKALKERRYLSISTGRSFTSGGEFVEDLKIAVPTSYQNGAIILDHSKSPPEVMRKVLLGNESAKKIITYAKDAGLTFVLFKDSFELPDMLMEKVPESPYSDYYLKNSPRIRLVDNIGPLLDDFGIIEVALEGEESKIKEVLDELDLSPDTVTVVKNNEIENHAFYELFGPGVGKGHALRFLADHLGLSREEIAFIGDNFNDLEAMQAAGLSVAMSNAPAAVKAVATLVTSSNNDDSGVAEAIELILGVD